MDKRITVTVVIRGTRGKTWRFNIRVKDWNRYKKLLHSIAQDELLHSIAQAIKGRE